MTIPADRAALLAAKAAHMVPCLYHFYREPLVLVRGLMETLYDAEGRAYLDAFSGVAVTSAGHANPEIAQATIAQLGQLQHATTIYLTTPIIELARGVAALAPGDARKCFFVNSGSEAVEGALLLARLAKQAPHLVSLSNSLHGRTHMSMSVTGLPMWRTDPHPYPEISFAPAPYCLRCELGKTYPSCDLACAKRVGEIIDEVEAGGTRVAALILEPVQGNGGIVVPPPGYLERVREITLQRGVLLIADEVQTGFGRTGRGFALEHAGIAADVMAVAKALGNGMGIGAFVAAPEIAAAYTRPGASTTGGSPLAAATALAVLDYHERHRLAERAERVGAKLLDDLQVGLAKRSGVAEIRGLGLMVGIELARPDGAPDAARCDAVLEALKVAGILAGKTGAGRNVLTLLPPLIIPDAAAEMLAREVIKAVKGA